MQLVFALSLFTSSYALQIVFEPPTRVPVGESLTIRCCTNKTDGSVWALHFAFRNSTNSFQVLRRTNKESASIFLGSDGYPKLFEKPAGFPGGIQINESRENCDIQLNFRINMATNGSQVTCKEMLYDNKEGDSRNRSIVVFRKPSLTLLTVQADSTGKTQSKVVAVPVGITLKMACRADFGSPPVSELDINLHLGPTPLSTLFADCRRNVKRNQKICQFEIKINKRMNGSFVQCFAGDGKGSLYSSDKTKILANKAVSLMMEGNIYACNQPEFYKKTIYVKTRPKVADVAASLMAEKQRLFKGCNVTDWRLRRNIGNYKKTNETVIQMKRNWANAFVNLNGTEVTRDIDDVRGLSYRHLKPTEFFFHVKDFINVVDIFGDNSLQ